MKRVFIVNPMAGNGKSIAIMKEIEKILEGEDYQIYYTNNRYEATMFAHMFKDSSQPIIIYSVGGDGTLLEVVNGISDSHNILGIIPTGTGNDFVKSINNDDIVTYTNLCKMNDNYFINIASIGIDALIAKALNESRDSLIPKSLRYKVSILNTLLNYEPQQIEAYINHQAIKQSITLLAICNGQYYGGGFRIAPHAQINDDKFDIYLADELKTGQILKLLFKLVKGTHEQSPYVHVLQSNRVIIKSPIFLTCNLDGEIFYCKKMDFHMDDHKIPIYTANDKIKKLCKSKGLYK